MIERTLKYYKRTEFIYDRENTKFMYQVQRDPDLSGRGCSDDHLFVDRLLYLRAFFSGSGSYMAERRDQYDRLGSGRVLCLSAEQKACVPEQ